MPVEVLLLKKRKQVLGIDDADNFIEAFLINRQAGIMQFFDSLDDFTKRCIVSQTVDVEALERSCARNVIHR